MSADRRYDSQTDEMEYRLGWINDDDIHAKRGGGDPFLLRAKREKFVDDLYERAKRIADKYGISIQETADRLSLIGNTSFTMARRDTGDEALQTDSEGNAVDQTPKTGAKPKQNSSKGQANATVTLKIDQAADSKPAAKTTKRKLRFTRDVRGVLTGAEIEET